MPGENIPSSTETQTFVTYDAKNLYIGFKAFDDPNLMYVERTPSFRADNGFVDLNDQRQFNLTGYRVLYPKTDLIEHTTFVGGYGRVLSHDWDWSQVLQPLVPIIMNQG